MQSLSDYIYTQEYISDAMHPCHKKYHTSSKLGAAFYTSVRKTRKHTWIYMVPLQ